MAKKKLAAILLTAAVLTGVSMQANAVDMGVSGKLNLPNAQTTAYAPTQQTAARSLADNKSSTELYQTVTRIGNKILAANNIQTAVNFELVQEDVANAATSMENTVYVYTGLLSYCQSDDELAFVIGHEIGHAVKSHVIKGAVIETTVATGAKVGNTVLNTKIARSSFGSKMNSLGLGDMVSGAASTAVNAAGTAAVAKVNRGQEVDADLLGVDFAVKAGYNPNAAITIMEKIGDRYNDFFADHPSTEKRVATMQKYIEEKYPQYANNKAYK